MLPWTIQLRLHPLHSYSCCGLGQPAIKRRVPKRDIVSSLPAEMNFTLRRNLEQWSALPYPLKSIASRLLRISYFMFLSSIVLDFDEPIFDMHDKYHGRLLKFNKGLAELDSSGTIHRRIVKMHNEYRECLLVRKKRKRELCSADRSAPLCSAHGYITLLFSFHDLELDTLLYSAENDLSAIQ